MNGTGYEWEYAKKIDNRTTAQKISNFIFDPETNAILGRTPKSWGTYQYQHLRYILYNIFVF